MALSHLEGLAIRFHKFSIFIAYICLHSGNVRNEDGGFLGCCVVLCGRNTPTFQRRFVPPSPEKWCNLRSSKPFLRVTDASRASEMLENFYQTTRRYNLED